MENFESIASKEGFIKNVLESLDEPVFITDFSGKILWNNTAVSGISAEDPEKIPGRKLLEIFIQPDDMASEWISCLEKLSSGNDRCEASQHLQGKYYTVKGSVIPATEHEKVILWRWVDITGRVLSEIKAKHLKSIFGAIRELNHIITKEKNPESLVRKVCERLYESGCSGHVWAILVDGKGRAYEAFEVGSGKNILRLRESIETGRIPPCVKDTFDNVEPVVLKRSSCEAFDCPMVKGNGFRGGGVSMKLEYSGRMWGFLTVCRAKEFGVTKEELGLLKSVAEDVSFALHSINVEIEKEKSLEILEKTENMFRLLVEHSFFGLAILKADGTFEYLNPRFTEITGYTIDEVPNRAAWFELAFPDQNYKKEILSSWRKVWGEDHGGGDTSEGTYRIRCKDGEYKILRFRSVILEDGRIISSCEDITEKENLQLQLQQSQKMEAIGRLAGGIAHDFNNLLTTILGMVDLLLMDITESDPKHRDLLEIRKAAKRASHLTKQLLAFSRRQVLRPSVLNLNDVVAEMGKMLQRLIGEDIELITVFDENLGNVMVDQSQIEQVIMNLVVNSRDAMPDGGKLIIETANVDLDEEYSEKHVGVKPGPYVMLAITDTGLGMDEKTTSRIFEPFFTTKEKNKGTGLGLAMVYGIVKQSGGNVWVYSEPGKGTTFKIYLPRVSETSSSVSTETIRQDDLRGSETILVVEDDEMVRRLARQMLSKAGYRVLDAGSGEEAIRIARENEGQIDLVITDVVMPRMSGKELTEKLKEMGLVTKALYISGYTDNAIVKHGILEEGIEFIQKPFSMNVLLRKVRVVLEKD